MLINAHYEVALTQKRGNFSGSPPAHQIRASSQYKSEENPCVQPAAILRALLQGESKSKPKRKKQKSKRKYPRFFKNVLGYYRHGPKSFHLNSTPTNTKTPMEFSNAGHYVSQAITRIKQTFFTERFLEEPIKLQVQI